MNSLLFLYIIFTFLITLFYAILILYYLLGWQSVSIFKSKGSDLTTKVTVIVPARNEQENILQLLNCFKLQSYSKELFDVIIVDDHSEDLTAELVENFDLKNLQLIHLKDYVQKDEIAYKKRAVEAAIQHSDGELIITTDADCTMGKNWIKEIVAFYEETHSKFIVAPVDYKPVNSVLDVLQTLDFLSIMGVTAASVYHKLFNLSNGANMAYQRETFLQLNGYQDIDQSASGDDVFLVEKIGRKYPDDVNYLKSKHAIVYTQPCSNFRQLFNQRMRWISKTKHYTDFKTKIIAVLYFLFYLFLLSSMILSFIKPIFINLLIIQIFVKLLVDFALLEEVTHFFKKSKLMWYYPIFQVTHFPFTLAVSFCSQFFKFTWKNRTLKQ